MGKWKGDHKFIIGAPTYKILNQSTLPTFLKLAGQFGTYLKGDQTFELRTGGTVYFRTSSDPESIEGISNVRAVWLDEAGKCKAQFWINAEGRAARTNAPLFLTTTPYGMNWPYQQLIKPFKAGERKDVSYYEWLSIDNPSFPKEEYERQKLILDQKTFRRKYMGLHERMEGLVYELSSDNFCDPYDLPNSTRFFAGVDFGFAEGHEFAIIIRAFTTDGMHHDVYEFKQAGLDPNGQVMMAKSLQSIYPIEVFYCDPARPDMIAAFNKAGLAAIGFHVGREAYKPIMAGITKQIELLRSGKYKIFRGKCPNLEDEYETYHWKENAEEIIEKEVPVPINDHLMDCIFSEELIATERGDKKISKIVVGESVLTRRGFKKVLDAWMVGNRECIKLYFSNNKSLICTPEHLIFTKNKGWTTADALSYDDIICEKENVSNLMGSNILDTRNQFTGSLGCILNAIITISKKASDYIIGIFGRILMALFRLATQFIIKMETASITPLRISFVSPYQSTHHTTQKTDLNAMSIEKRISSIWRVLGQQLQCGTSQQMDINGTKSTPKNSKRLRLKGFLIFARSATKHIWLGSLCLCRVAQNIVTKIVKCGLGEKDCVRLVSKESAGLKSVWDISVEDEYEFFANGILVHNCVRYVTVGTMHLKASKEPRLMSSRVYGHVDNFDPTKKKQNKNWNVL
jgi:hypothetical protein